MQIKKIPRTKERRDRQAFVIRNLSYELNLSIIFSLCCHQGRVTAFWLTDSRHKSILLTYSQLPSFYLFLSLSLSLSLNPSPFLSSELFPQLIQSKVVDTCRPFAQRWLLFLLSPSLLSLARVFSFFLLRYTKVSFKTKKNSFTYTCAHSY